MGTSHVRTLASWVPGARVTCGVRRRRGRAPRRSPPRSAPTSPTSAEALIASADVDAVLIAAPDPLHEELALACLAAGKPTLCEKPLATTVDGSQRIVDAEVAVGRRLVQVGFMRRFDPAFVELRDLVADGELGDVAGRPLRAPQRAGAPDRDVGRHRRRTR